jgi:excisionase family DNA binding protein
VSDVFANVTWLTIPEAAELLGIPLGKVHRLLEEHQLVEVRVDGVRKIPADAIQDGVPLPSLHGTIIVLLDAGLTLEAAIEWLYTENDYLECTPISALVAGRKSPVRRATQALAF